MLDELIKITKRAQEELQNNNLDSIGHMLDQAWQLKKQFSSNVSNASIDYMYNTAMNAGALGGKILGAGGGGFLMLYVPLHKQGNVKQALRKYKQVDIAFEPQGSKIIYVN